MEKMRRVLMVLAVVIAGVFWVTTAFAQGLTGSAHDFSDGDTWNTSGEKCLPCHTPHNADITVAVAPLWSHEVTTATYTLYSGIDMQATDLGQPDGVSKLCLSCHDGTVALDNFGGNTGGTNFIGGAELVGVDLSDDHPISFTYDATLAGLDTDLHNPTLTNSGLGGTITADMLFTDKVECASCHNVHNESGAPMLLVKSNANSDLCLTCHNK
jgi:predicted CXXCH cytochrome family protein